MLLIDSSAPTKSQNNHDGFDPSASNSYPIVVVAGNYLEPTNGPKMLIKEFHKNVSTTASGQGTMREHLYLT